MEGEVAFLRGHKRVRWDGRRLPTRNIKGLMPRNGGSAASVFVQPGAEAGRGVLIYTGIWIFHFDKFPGPTQSKEIKAHAARFCNARNRARLACARAGDSRWLFYVYGWLGGPGNKYPCPRATNLAECTFVLAPHFFTLFSQVRPPRISLSTPPSRILGDVRVIKF